MLGCRLSRLLKELEPRIKCKNVKFSKPIINSDTSVNTPSKYAIGGLREHGEWISTFCSVYRVLEEEKVDFNVFMSTKTGRLFIKSLASRVYSLHANDIYEILLTLSLYKVRIGSLESVLLEELEESLQQLHTHQLLNIPSIVGSMDGKFKAKLSKVVVDRLTNKNEESTMYNRIVNILEDDYNRRLRS